MRVQKVMCSECSLSFMGIRRLKAHQAMHKTFKCGVCSKICSSANILQRHAKLHMPIKHALYCWKCGQAFNRQDNLNAHVRRCTLEESGPPVGPGVIQLLIFDCAVCGETFNTMPEIRSHHLRKHAFVPKVKREPSEAETTVLCSLCRVSCSNNEEMINHVNIYHPYSEKFEVTQTAFSGSCITYTIRFPDDAMLSAEQLFNSHMPSMKSVIDHELAMLRVMKFAVIIFARLIKVDMDGNVEKSEVFPMRTKQVTISMSSRPVLERELHNMREVLQERIDHFEEAEGSGWVMDCITCLHLEFAKLRFVAGAKKRAGALGIRGEKYLISSMQNDNACFLFALAQAFFTEEKPILEIWDWINANVKWQQFPLPFDVCNVKAFENVNSHLEIGFNVILLEREKLLPMYVSKRKEVTKVNLLLYATADSGYHFAYITDLSKFVCTFSGWKRRFVCVNCLSTHATVDTLASHEVKCLLNAPQLITFPPKFSKIKFSVKDHLKRFSVHFFGVADFECCMQEPVAADVSIINEHKPVSFSLLIFGPGNVLFYEKTYASDEDCLPVFLDSVEQFSNLVTDFRVEQEKKPMNMSLLQKEAYKKAGVCHICKKNFFDDDSGNFTKVRDHDHITTQFLGAAHNLCNRNRRENYKIPVFFHNFSGYDSHILIQALKEDERPADVLDEGEEANVIGESLNPRFETGEGSEDEDDVVSHSSFINDEEEEEVSWSDNESADDLLLEDSDDDVPLAQLYRKRKKEGAGNDRATDNVPLAQKKKKEGMRQKPQLKPRHRWRIEVLAYNTEKFRLIQYGPVCFQDSMHFLNTSLETIVTSLMQSGCTFPLLTELQFCKNDEQKDLCLQKGNFPYEFFHSVSQFRQLTEIPPKHTFFSTLKDETISDSAHEHAKKVYDVFGFSNMEQYLLHYNKLDCILLAQAIIEFRTNTRKNFDLEMLHFISLPQLAFTAMLKLTNVTIDPIFDIDHLLFAQEFIRGGASYVSLRHAKATESEKIVYVDANVSICGVQMCKSYSIHIPPCRISMVEGNLFGYQHQTTVF